jgi:hypothetical protein
LNFNAFYFLYVVWANCRSGLPVVDFDSDVTLCPSMTFAMIQKQSPKKVTFLKITLTIDGTKSSI